MPIISCHISLSLKKGPGFWRWTWPVNPENTGGFGKVVDMDQRVRYEAAHVAKTFTAFRLQYLRIYTFAAHLPSNDSS